MYVILNARLSLEIICTQDLYKCVYICLQNPVACGLNLNVLHIIPLIIFIILFQQPERVRVSTYNFPCPTRTCSK